MSNIKTVQELIEAVRRGDIEAFRQHLADDVRWEYHPAGNSAQERDVPYMRLREGRQAAGGFVRDIQEDFELHSLDVQSILEGDNSVAVKLGYELTVKATGKRIRDEEIHLYEIGPDGKVTAFRHFLDTAKAIEAHA
jgi:ketosteroid isomerase-like protein